MYVYRKSGNFRVINPRRMREGYCCRSVCVWVRVYVCVCVSVTALPATDTVSMSQMQCCKVPYRVQEFRCHLQVTASFLAPWWAFDGICMARDRFSKTTGSSLIVAHSQISFLACCWHGTRLCTAVWHTWYWYYAFAYNMGMRTFLRLRSTVTIDMQPAQCTCCFLNLTARVSFGGEQTGAFAPPLPPEAGWSPLRVATNHILNIIL